MVKRYFDPTGISATPSVQPGMTWPSGNTAGWPRAIDEFEHRAVEQPPLVMDRDRVGRRRTRAGALGEDLVLEAGSRRVHAGFILVSGKIGAPCGRSLG